MLKIKFNDEFVYVNPEDNTDVEACHYVKSGNLLVMRDGLPYTHKSSWESIAEYLMSDEGKEAIVEAMLVENYSDGYGGGRINKLINQDTRGKARQ